MLHDRKKPQPLSPTSYEDSDLMSLDDKPESSLGDSEEDEAEELNK